MAACGGRMARWRACSPAARHGPGERRKGAGSPQGSRRGTWLDAQHDIAGFRARENSPSLAWPLKGLHAAAAPLICQ